MPATLKEARYFLESPKYSNSWLSISVGLDMRNVDLTMADCSRNINWYFSKNRAGKAKIAKVKKAVDSIYNYLHDTEE